MHLVLLLLVAATGCGTYASNRSALVPHATPRMTSGRPSPAQGALIAGASSVAHLGNPKVGDDPNAGVVIPGTQLFGALKGQLRDFSFGLLYENGLDATAKKIKPTQPAVNNGNVQGFGLALDYSIPTGDPKFRVGLGVEAMSWRVPWVEFSACIDPDPELCIVDRASSKGTDGVITLAASVAPSYEVNDSVAVFGSLTMKNHPTIQQKILESDPGLFDADVKDGPANFIVAAGAELTIADALLATVILYYDVTRNPVAYGPGASVLLTVPFGKRTKAAPAAPTTTAPSPMAPPPPPPPMAPPPPM